MIHTDLSVVGEISTQNMGSILCISISYSKCPSES